MLFVARSLFHFHAFRCGLLLFVFYYSYVQSSSFSFFFCLRCCCCIYSLLQASYFCEWLFFSLKIKADLDEFCELLITSEWIQIDACEWVDFFSISLFFRSTRIDVGIWVEYILTKRTKSEFHSTNNVLFCLHQQTKAS